DPITVQTTYTATTSMMPAAMENRNDVFITDHGSSRDSLNRALRVRRATPGFGFGAPSGASAEPYSGANSGTGGCPSTAGMTAVDGPAVGAQGLTSRAGSACRATGCWSAASHSAA